MTGQTLADNAGPDSLNTLPALLGESATGRDHLIEHAGTLALRVGNWKLIEPNKGPAVSQNVNIEVGNAPRLQLYDLSTDIGERKNVAEQHADRVAEMVAKLKQLKDAGRTR